MNRTSQTTNRIDPAAPSISSIVCLAGMTSQLRIFRGRSCSHSHSRRQPDEDLGEQCVRASACGGRVQRDPADAVDPALGPRVGIAPADDHPVSPIQLVGIVPGDIARRHAHRPRHHRRRRGEILTMGRPLVENEIVERVAVGGRVVGKAVGVVRSQVLRQPRHASRRVSRALHDLFGQLDHFRIDALGHRQRPVTMHRIHRHIGRPLEVFVRRDDRIIPRLIRVLLLKRSQGIATVLELAIQPPPSSPGPAADRACSPGE